MPKPRRCYTYTTDEQLDADVRDGLISQENATTLQNFRAFLQAQPKPVTNTPDEGVPQ